MTKSVLTIVIPIKADEIPTRTKQILSLSKNYWLGLTAMVLGDSKFEFRFRSSIQFLPLWSMDDRAEAEFRIAVAKYHHRLRQSELSSNWKIIRIYWSSGKGTGTAIDTTKNWALFKVP